MSISFRFYSGADFVMLGGMLAGHDESGNGEIIERNGRKFKLFYGMSSKTAMDKHVRNEFDSFLTPIEIFFVSVGRRR